MFCTRPPPPHLLLKSPTSTRLPPSPSTPQVYSAHQLPTPAAGISVLSSPSYPPREEPSTVQLSRGNRPVCPSHRYYCSPARCTSQPSRGKRRVRHREFLGRDVVQPGEVLGSRDGLLDPFCAVQSALHLRTRRSSEVALGGGWPLRLCHARTGRWT